MNKQKVGLVTGATGFIGKHLCKRLVDNGWEVHVICRTSSDVLSLKEFIKGTLVCHYYDGVNDDLIAIVRQVQPTVVFHLASLFLAQHTFKDILPLIQSNVVFSTQLVEAMVQNKIYNLVNTGTSWQHYNSEAYNPVCLYAATKQAFEDILKYYQETTELKVITLKLFDTYGPYDTRPKIFALFNKISRSQEDLAMSPGEQYIDFVYIDDVVDAFLLAAKYVENGECLGEYAVSSLQPLTLKEIAKTYEKASNERLNIIWGGRPYREREVMIPWNKGKVLPGWAPKVSLEQGIVSSKLNDLKLK